MKKNCPELWLSDLPKPGKDANKYDRGHLVILGGVDMTGAARLASEAAMHMGCGLCTIVSSEEVKTIYLSGAPHVMFEPYKNLGDFASHVLDVRRTACIVGPGAGKSKPEELRAVVLGLLELKKPVVLDADSLNVFEGMTDKLFTALHENCVLTPHEGEFVRLFPDLKGMREERALDAAKLTGATILLKGAETIIATPVEVIINDHAAPWLATAGAGDVLAGMIGGLLAQGMAPFKACAAATWVHGEAGVQLGAGLVAPDIVAVIPEIIKHL
jgi:ADP-dependent NAD(P)H-hydrate dehydratase / NAD(P)H-hydrate epimerase